MHQLRPSERGNSLRRVNSEGEVRLGRHDLSRTNQNRRRIFEREVMRNTSERLERNIGDEMGENVRFFGSRCVQYAIDVCRSDLVRRAQFMSKCLVNEQGVSVNLEGFNLWVSGNAEPVDNTSSHSCCLTKYAVEGSCTPPYVVLSEVRRILVECGFSSENCNLDNVVEVSALLHGFSTSSNPSLTAVCSVVLTLFYGDVYDTERSQIQAREVLNRATERTRRVVAMANR